MFKASLDGEVGMAVAIQQVSWFKVWMLFWWWYRHQSHSHDYFPQQSKWKMQSKLLWQWVFWHLYQVIQLQLAGLPKEGSFSFYWCQVRRVGEKWEILIIDKIYKMAGANLQSGRKLKVSECGTFWQSTRVCYSFYWNRICSLWSPPFLSKIIETRLVCKHTYSH